MVVIFLSLTKKNSTAFEDNIMYLTTKMPRAPSRVHIKHLLALIELCFHSWPNTCTSTFMANEFIF